MPKSCSHWKSEYDASPCDLCELEEKAARERAERLDELERALSNANAALEEERKESAAWHATATDKGASSRRAAAERDEWKVRAEKAEAAAEHMTEQYRGMSALRDALLERAEAAEARLATPAHRHVDGGHFDAPDDACVLCTVIRSRDAAEAALAKTVQDAQLFANAQEVVLAQAQEQYDKMEATLAKVTEERDALKEAFNSKDTRRYQNGVDDGRVAAEKERDAALKACAEMRAAMARVADFAHHAEDCAKWSDFRGAECDCGAKGARNDVDHALSSNAGKGYLSPTEADALKEAVREACAVEGAQRCMRGDVRSPARLPDEVAKAIRSLDLAAILKEG